MRAGGKTCALERGNLTRPSVTDAALFDVADLHLLHLQKDLR